MTTTRSGGGADAMPVLVRGKQWGFRGDLGNLGFVDLRERIGVMIKRQAQLADMRGDQRHDGSAFQLHVISRLRGTH